MSYQPHAEPIRFQCRHIFTDGRRCKNPTLRSPQSGENPGGHENFCYFHHTTRRPIEDPKTRRSRRSTFTLPQLEDRSAIQLAIGEVLQKIASNDIDPRRAGLLLYGLQIASLNLKQDRGNNSDEPDETETVDEITHDPTLGNLAPPAELYSTEPKGTAQRLLEELAWDEKEDILPTLQAVAGPMPPRHTRSTRHRTRPNQPRLKNLCKKSPGGGSSNITHPASSYGFLSLC